MTTKIYEPATEWRKDLLERIKHIDEFLGRLSNHDGTSTYGIYGSWGTGKTSFLKMAENRYQEWAQSQTRSGMRLSIQYVDTWLYEQTGNLVTPIMVLLQRMTQNPESIHRIARKVVAVTSFLMLDVLMRSLSAGILELEDAQKQLDAIEAHEDARLKMVDYIDQARSDFKNAADLACKSAKCERIIFLLDNLDRCSPDRAIALLESIKHVFSASNQCIWVLALDPDVVASFIGNKYGGTILDGYSYLDKLIPEHFHLPLLQARGGRGTVVDFLSHYLNEPIKDLPLNHDVLLQLPRVLVPRRLIKVARKYNELKEPGRHTFVLILLYQCWPTFYRWLSINDKEYIRLVLTSFATSGKTDKTENIVLPEIFRSDQELLLFISSAFSLTNSKSQQALGSLADDIRQAILELREVGLP